MDKLKDISLYYFGGSGGFLLLHLLMLSDQFYCSFPPHNNVSFTEILKKQWDVKNHHDWKKSEIWPDNHVTFSSITDKRKIYFYCNPTAETIRPDTLNILLYTDIKTQLILSKYKNASYFFKFSRYAYLKNKIKLWRAHYNAIMAETWPKCNSIKHFNNLPEYIKTELLENPYTAVNLTIANNDQELVNDFFNRLVLDNKTFLTETNDLVSVDVFNIMPYMHTCYKLQEIINDINIINNITHVNLNTNQQNLLKHWKSLHTKELLNSIGVQE